jgi:hypothetical protein
MRSFQQYLEDTNMLAQKPVGDIVQSAAKEIGAEIVTNAIPYGGLAKAIIKSVWGGKDTVSQNIQNSNALNRAKQTIRQRIQQDINSGKSSSKALRPAVIESEVEAHVGSTESSQAYLSEQEKQGVINSIIQAVNNNTIVSGFAQNLVNEILKQKISGMQKALSESQPRTSS